MTGKLVVENLKHRPMRALLSILLIGVPVTLILTLVGLSYGMSEDSQRRQNGVGADIVIRASTTTSVTSSSGVSIPEHLVDWIEKQQHVSMAIGVVNHSIEFPLVVTGLDLDKFDRMNGGFTYLKGGRLRAPDDILIDRSYATQKHASVGSTISVMNRPWHVAGIIANGKLARVVVPLKTLQDLESATGKVSQIYVKLDNPVHTNEVIESLRSQIPEYPMMTMADFVSMFSVDNTPGVKSFLMVIMGVGVVIGFAVVCLSMYMSVLQRTREIGILKSLGASKGFILGIVLIEALLLGIGGTLLGIVMSYGSMWLIDTFAPLSIPMIIVYWWWPIAGGITLAGSVLGSLYPGLYAASQDPIEALAYE